MAVDEAQLREALANRYDVEACVGSGGSAAVFRAHDLKHHRTVAIKVLHPELTDSIGPARFLAEIELAARLNHPHILPLYDSGEAAGHLYYVMPYVTGESLRALIEREKQLPIERAVQFACEAAEALEYAHRQGRIHRDVKPENILLSEGHALVADFGIAKATQVDAHGLTSPGTVLGTPAYMSPEQWSGATPVDGRSDVYALACTLYEMLGGQPPFQGSTAQTIAYQHLSVEPRPVTSLRATIPASLSRVIQRGLAKAPSDRPQSMAEFVQALHTAMQASHAAQDAPTVAVRAPGVRRRRLPWPAVAAGAVILLGVVGVLAWQRWFASRPESNGLRNSIAVLPLRDLSGDRSKNYFADGMTDELVTCLSKISSLTVISSSATAGYRESAKPLSQVARELGVRFVIEGSVARDLGKIRIGTRLIEAATGRNLWAESYERADADVFSLQSDVALAVARQIQAQLTPAERAAITTPARVDPKAHDLLLQARFASDTGTRDGMQHSIQLMKQAIAIDPEFAPAYAELANSYYFLSGWFLPSREAMPLARQYAEKALGIDPGLAEAMAVRGLVTYHYDWRFDEGLAELRVAATRNPGSALCHQWYAYTLSETGHFDEGRAEFARARELDPISEQLHWFSLWPDFYQRRYGDALAALNTLRAEDESYWPAYSLLGETYEQLGDFSRARSTLQRAIDLGGNPWVTAALARVEAEAGRPEEARRLLRVLEAEAETTYIQPYALATVYAHLGDTDRAFAELEQCFTDRSEDVSLLLTDPRVDLIRKDPRFDQIMKRLGKGKQATGPVTMNPTRRTHA